VDLKLTYRRELDGLRALAVAAVIVNHFSVEAMPSGYLGVDIFFVISGYVISATLFGNPGTSLPDALLAFYLRRIKRLVPALVLCVAVTGLLICLFNPSPGASLMTGIASLFGVSNLYLLDEATDYFGASAATNVFTHTWSLGVEEQFYLFFPVLAWLARFGRLPRERAGALPAIVAILTLLSVLAFFHLSQARPQHAFYLMPTRLWELGAGVLVFASTIGRGGGRTQPGWMSKVVAPLAAAGIVLVLFAPEEQHVAATIAVVALASLLVATLREGVVVHGLFASDAAVYIGRISYSLYLWHWSVLAISRWTVGIHAWTIPFQAVLMLALAALSYRYVERPLRAAPWSARRGAAIGYGVAALACTALFLAMLGKPLKGHLYAGTRLQMAAVGAESLVRDYQLPGTSWKWRGEKCVLSGNEQVGKAIPVGECTLGNFDEAKRRILVIGNSYSPAFVPAFDDLVSSGQAAVTITSSLGASVVPEIPNGGPWNEANDYYWRKVVPGLASRLRSGDVLFLVNDMAEFSPEKAPAASAYHLALLKAGLEKLHAEHGARGVRIAVLHGIAFARDAGCAPAAAASQWFAPMGGPCRFFSREETLQRRKALDDVLRGLRDAGKIIVVDLMDVFCPGKRCDYTGPGGIVLYRDEWSHPSVEAARLSAGAIRRALAGEP
jgi:peptidoglycan/LPS O-acetylase OafA/YrhL